MRKKQPIIINTYNSETSDKVEATLDAISITLNLINDKLGELIPNKSRRGYDITGPVWPVSTSTWGTPGVVNEVSNKTSKVPKEAPRKPLTKFILEYLEKHKDTAFDTTILYRAARSELGKINRTSVNKTLSTLFNQGKIDRVDIGVYIKRSVKGEK